MQSDEEDDFFDAVETAEPGTEFTVDVPISSHRRTSSGISTDSQVSFLIPKTKPISPEYSNLQLKNLFKKKSEGREKESSGSENEIEPQEEKPTVSQTVRCIRSKVSLNVTQEKQTKYRVKGFLGMRNMLFNTVAFFHFIFHSITCRINLWRISRSRVQVPTQSQSHRSGFVVSEFQINQTTL